MRNFKKNLALILCIVLIAATALFATGCINGDIESPETTDSASDNADTTVLDTTEKADDEKSNVLGEGKTQFTFKVVDKNGNETVFTNALWERPKLPEGEKEMPRVPGRGLTEIDDYDTPLALELLINHVGDCYE